MNKKKLIELRCKAWGITGAEYYCNQCSDFSLEDMARAYRRGKNKGRADLEKENAELKEKWQENDKAWWEGFNTCKEKCGSGNVELTDNFTKATKIIKDLLFIYYDPLTTESDVKHHHKILADARQFLKDSEVH